MFFDRTQKDKDVIQVDMDELTDAISKDSSHQLLEHRGCAAVTHLHYLAPECAKYCGKCCLTDMFRYDVYLFIRFGHIKL